MTRYWNEEPWGAYRDNLHAALIARTIHNANYKRKVTLDEFMVKRPEAKKESGATKESVFGMFKMLAGDRKRAAKRAAK